MVNNLPTCRQPRFLQLIRWIINPLGLMEVSARRYGDMFGLRLSMDSPLIFISNPETIQEIFSQDAKNFDAGRANCILRPIVGDNSLILLDGVRHKRQRKLLMPPFHGERMHSYSQTISKITEGVFRQLEVGQTFVARQLMQTITLDVIMKAVFGLEDGDRYAKLKPLLAGMLEQTGSPLGSAFLFYPFLQKDWGPWGKMKQQKQEILSLLQAEIDERREAGNIAGEDILSLMMTARDENGEAMTDEELQDELMTLLFAGHETTATALAWVLYWTYKLPQVKEKLDTEIASLGSEPELLSLLRLPYLNAVCNETLRIYPVAPITFPRVNTVPVTLQGREFPPETGFAPCVYLVHHRPDIYPEPKQFKPERFLERNYSRTEFMPFGGGNRRCIGYALALTEMKLVLATVLSNYQLTLAETKPVKPTRRGVTIAPNTGVVMKFEGQRSLTQLKTESNLASV